MNKEEILTFLADVLNDKNVIVARGFDERNFRPHQFVIGANHTIKAEKENKGVLSEEILAAIPCEHVGCVDSYEEHTSDKVLILQLRRDATNVEVNEELIKLKGVIDEFGIKSLAFADTLEKFKFIQDGDKSDEGESPS